MSKTISTCILETNQIQNKPQENAYFHTLYRTQADFPNEFLRTAKSTSPIQVCAVFSAMGPDNLGATINVVLNKELEKIVAEALKNPVLDFDLFSNKVITTLNMAVCNFNVSHGGAQLKVSMTMTIVEGDTLRVIHIGNTKAVLIRDGKLMGLTEEHTLAKRYVQMGAISLEEEKTHPDNMTLTQYLGKMPQDGPIIADKKVHVKLKDNDEICLMGLGISKDMPARNRNVILVKPTSTEIKARELINSAYGVGIKTGLSVVLIKIESTFLLPGDAVIDSNLASDGSVAVVDNKTSETQEGYVPLSEPVDTNPMSGDVDNETKNFALTNEDVSEDVKTKDNGKEIKFESKKKRIALNILIPVLIGIVCVAMAFGLLLLIFKSRGIVSFKPKEVYIENAVFIMYVKEDETILYDSEELTSPVSDPYLDRGQQVAVLEEIDGVCHVRTADEREGYLSMSALVDDDPTLNDAPESFEETSETEESTETSPTIESTVNLPDYNYTEPVAPTTEATTTAAETTAATTVAETTVETTTEATTEATEATAEATTEAAPTEPAPEVTDPPATEAPVE